MTDTSAMECRDALELMAAAVDGALTAGERASFEAHVGRCERCAEELRRSRRLAAALGALPTEAAVSEALERTVLGAARAALSEGTPARIAAGQRPARRLAWTTWSVRGLAAAAALVIAVGVWQRWADVPGAAPAPAVTTPGQGVPGEVLASPQRFLDMPVVERLEMLEYLQRSDQLEADDGPAVERG